MYRKTDSVTKMKVKGYYLPLHVWMPGV